MATKRLPWYRCADCQREFDGSITEVEARHILAKEGATAAKMYAAEKMEAVHEGHGGNGG